MIQKKKSVLTKERKKKKAVTKIALIERHESRGDHLSELKAVSQILFFLQ